MKLSVLVPVGDLTETCPYRKRALKWLLKRYDRLLPEAEVVLGHGAAKPYNRSSARNGAFARSCGDVLLAADADTLFHPEQIHEALELIDNGAPWVIPYRGGARQGPSDDGGYYNLSEETSNHWLDHAPEFRFEEPDDPSMYEHKLNSWAGLLVVPRVAWEKIGGFDEEFRSWGYEDVAFRAALDHRVGHHVRTDGWIAHLWHPAPESECFGQPFIELNRARCKLYEQGILP